MASLKNIKTRIRTVSSTKKLTSAMKLIATAKLRHSLEQLEIIKNYEESFLKALQWAQWESVCQEGLAEKLPSFFFQETPNKPHAVYVIGAQKGLCGNYDLMMIRKALSVQHDQKIIFIPLTLKSLTFFTKEFPNDIAAIPEVKLDGKHVDIENLAHTVTNHIFHSLETETFGSASLICGKFVNALVQVPCHISLFPVFELEKQESNNSMATSKPTFEPSLLEMTELIVHVLTKIKICKALTESETCEQASRVTIMDSSSRNAEKLIDNLTLQYNRTRQANITNELIEIVAGTNALLED